VSEEGHATIEKKSKQSPIGEIPEDWKVVKVSDIFEVYGGTTPSTKNANYWNGDIYWVTPTDITKSEGLYLKDTEKKITRKAVKETSLRILPPGTLLLTSRATIGHTIINSSPVTINQGITAFIKKNNNTDSVYYAYFLKYRKEYLKQLGGGSTFREVSRSTLKNLLIPLPPLPEQRKIAEILSTVDDAIQKVSAAIARTERLKKGLMQRLLTKGIGHKRFKFSKELGCEIPEEWEVVRLGEIVEIQSGKYFAYSEFCESGIKCFKIDNVGFGEILWKTISFLPENYSDKYSELVLGVGDIVLALNRPTIDGKLKIGRLSEADVPSILYQRVGRFIFKSEKIYRHFMFYLLMGEYFKKELSRMLIGTDQPYIRTPVLLKIKIPLPPLSEQRKIAEILSTVDRKLELERKRKEKLERIKKGLMNDLLTGRRRVKVDKDGNL